MVLPVKRCQRLIPRRQPIRSTSGVNCDWATITPMA
jgi:hypothetical protein